MHTSSRTEGQVNPLKFGILLCWNIRHHFANSWGNVKQLKLKMVALMAAAALSITACSGSGTGGGQANPEKVTPTLISEGPGKIQAPVGDDLFVGWIAGEQRGVFDSKGNVMPWSTKASHPAMADKYEIGAIEGAVLLMGDLANIADQSGAAPATGLARVDPRTGKTVWEAEINTHGDGIMSPGVIVVETDKYETQSSHVAYSLETGKELYQIPALREFGKGKINTPSGEDALGKQSLIKYESEDSDVVFGQTIELKTGKLGPLLKSSELEYPPEFDSLEFDSIDDIEGELTYRRVDSNKSTVWSHKDKSIDWENPNYTTNRSHLRLVLRTIEFKVQESEIEEPVKMMSFIDWDSGKMVSTFDPKLVLGGRAQDIAYDLEMIDDRSFYVNFTGDDSEPTFKIFELNRP